ncbi:RDD family protein [Streptomyces spectabilis]|uniref:RDD family protein n=1 Tax=Streptomyces spectabilis TaxID=68270 RepID=UPI0033CF13F0
MSTPPPNPYGQPQQPQPGYGPGYGYPQQAPQGVPPQQGGYPGQNYAPYPQAQPGQSPYGAYPQAAGYGMGHDGRPELAHWGLRVGATLLDGLITVVPLYLVVGLAVGIGGEDMTAAASLVSVLALAYTVFMGFYQIHLEGKTGQTIGKRIVGIRVLREADGRFLGFGMAFVRKLAHFLDSIPCYIGYLWPLWDDKKQCFADKVCGTVVIKG